MEELMIDDTLYERYENLAILEEMYDNGEDISINPNEAYEYEDLEIYKEIYGKTI